MGGEKKTDSAEYSEECAREAREEEGAAEVMLDGFFVVDGEGGIHFANYGADGGGDGSGVDDRIRTRRTLRGHAARRDGSEDGVALERRIAGDGLG